MRGRKPEKFQLKPRDKAYLRKLLRDGETPWRLRVARRFCCSEQIQNNG